jgi:DNA-binding IclR family transcriptional regulator
VPRLPRRGLERFTENTVTTGAGLDEQLAETKRRGFATCRGEYEASAWGVSAPVVDSAGRLLAVLSIWGPGTRVTDARLDVLGPLVHSAAGMLLDR